MSNMFKKHLNHFFKKMGFQINHRELRTALRRAQPYVKTILPNKLYLRLKSFFSSKLNQNVMDVFDLEVKPAESVIPSCHFSDGRETGMLAYIPENFKLYLDKEVGTECELVICTAFHGRFEILETSIAESFNSKFCEKLRWVLCGSDSDDGLFIENAIRKYKKISGFLWANNPLGAKWDACVKMAGQLYKSELYCILGSDDILSFSLIDNIIEKHKIYQAAINNSVNVSKSGTLIPAMYYTDDWCIVNKTQYDTATVLSCNRLQDNHYIPIGAGRFYTRSFLKQSNFHIFDVSRENCLDDYGYLKVRGMALKTERYSYSEGYLISVKGSWKQMNSIQAIVNAESIYCYDYTINAYNNFKSLISPSTYNYLFPKEDIELDVVWS